MIYKVSYVVLGGDFPGGIRNQYEPPQVGERVQIGRLMFEVVEVQEVIPPRDDFQFLHATVKPISEETSDDAQPAAEGKSS
jgi:hypothetical protein